jgi:pyruvate dehydrogenase E1 component alpha subunit
MPSGEAARTPLDGGLLPEAELLQLLAPDGEYQPVDGYPVDLDDEELCELYALMVVTRRVDRALTNLQRQGQLGVYPPCLGQEGAQAGAVAALGERDWVFPQYRELTMALKLGVDVVDLAHLWRGTWLLHYDPYAHRFAPISISIGTHAVHAVGYAMGAQLDGGDSAVLACVGDGATSTTDVHEGLTFAGVHRAPTVFFVQNNQYAISVPVAEQTAAPTLAHRAAGYGMPGVRCDGNDVLASYAVTKRALERARAGEGPTLVEAVTYRLEAHTTADDAGRYRSREEVEAARAHDPVPRLRAFLQRRGLLDEELEAAVDKRADGEAARLQEEIFDAPAGEPLEIFDHVYSEPERHFEEQRDFLAGELRERGERG